jgi:hypothetical protein
MAWTKLTKDLFNKILLKHDESKEGLTFFLVGHEGGKYVGIPYKESNRKGFDCGGTNGWYLAFERVNLIWVGDLP